jgi:hypothetical protein
MSDVLAYIPFVHPINFFHEWWYLLLAPLAFGISVIYKAVRLPSLEFFWRSVVVMTLQIVLAMIGLAIALAMLVQFVVPMMRVDT